MRTPVTLVTGASGEIGHGLITRLSGTGRPIVTIDLAPLDPSLHRLVLREFTGSITDTNLLERVLAEFEVDLIFHLAALLSTRAEFTPITAHHVNVDGTLTLLEFAQREGESHGRTVLFLYPSSVAAYGLPDLATKTKVGRVREDEWNTPRTMYGCNKLYCEHLGRYYARFYKQLAAHAIGRVDFRCVRFPGLISAMTMPAGGTSDYAPEMIHAAARGKSLYVLRASRHAHPVHGDARCDLGVARSGESAAREPDAHGLQPHGLQSDRAADSRCGHRRHFPAPWCSGGPTRSVRASSIHGRRTSMTAPRAVIGASHRCTISRRRSTNI